MSRGPSAFFAETRAVDEFGPHKATLYENGKLIDFVELLEKVDGMQKCERDNSYGGGKNV